MSYEQVDVEVFSGLHCILIDRNGLPIMLGPVGRCEETT